MIFKILITIIIDTILFIITNYLVKLYYYKEFYVQWKNKRYNLEINIVIATTILLLIFFFTFFVISVELHQQLTKFIIQKVNH